MFGYHVIPIFILRLGFGTWPHCDRRCRAVSPVHLLDRLVCPPQ